MKVCLKLPVLFYFLWGSTVGADENAAVDTSIFDFQHAELALKWLHNPTQEILSELSTTSAAKHLKNHSDKTGYFPADATPE